MILYNMVPRSAVDREFEYIGGRTDGRTDGRAGGRRAADGLVGLSQLP